MSSSVPSVAASGFGMGDLRLETLVNWTSGMISGTSYSRCCTRRTVSPENQAAPFKLRKSLFKSPVIYLSELTIAFCLTACGGDCREVGSFYDDYYIDASIPDEDTQPPQTISNVGVSIWRGESQCGEGKVFLEFTRSMDDKTPVEEVGYELNFVEGELPDGLELPEGPKRLTHGPMRFQDKGTDDVVFPLIWDDENVDEQEPFDFVVTIAPVDLHGNIGEATDVEIYDPGGKCSTAVPGLHPCLPCADGTPIRAFLLLIGSAW